MRDNPEIKTKVTDSIMLPDVLQYDEKLIAQNLKELREEVGPIAKKESYYSIEFGSNKENSPEIVKHLDFVYLFIIHNGKLEQLILSKQDLAKNPELKIDGYVIDIMIFGQEEVISRFGNRSGLHFSWHQEGQGRGCFMTNEETCFFFKRLETDKYSGETFENLLKRADKTENNKIIGNYYFTEYLHIDGIPLSIEPVTRFEIETDKETYAIKIEQRAKDFITEIGDTTFSFHGNDILRLSTIDDFEKKLKGIHQALTKIETLTDMELTNEVIIRDADTARAMVIESQFVLPLKSIQKETKNLLQMTAEHELLHMVVRKKGLDKNATLNKIFELIFQKNKKFNVFLNFINEYNFMEGDADFGHSHSNIHEFNTSFLHSLMYIENMKENLNKTLTLRNISNWPRIEKRKLIQAEKTGVIDGYIEILEAMIDEEDTFGVLWDTKFENFLKEKLAYVKKLKEKY